MSVEGLRVESWPGSYGAEAHPRMGFFTDTSVCIGCKACEVACKEWNDVPEDGLNFTGESYDNTGRLSADTWRHVAFIEQQMAPSASDEDGFRWLMSSDVCKHCTEAACLDVAWRVSARTTSLIHPQQIVDTTATMSEYSGVRSSNLFPIRKELLE